MVLSCPHCANNAPYMRRDFCGQWVVCPKCETPFRWREADTAWGASPIEKEHRSPHPRHYQTLLEI